jgi:sensor histidine kinase YesM
MEQFFSRLALSDQQQYKLGRHVLFWLVCWLFMGFIYGFHNTNNKNTDFLFSYLESLAYLPQHMLLSYGIIYAILPHFIFKGKYGRGIFSVILLILFVAFLSPLISYVIITPLRKSMMMVERHNPLALALMAGLRGSMTVAGFAVAIKLVKIWYQKKVDHDRLEKEKLQAELQILKGQLNPHFMFNTLNSIYALALKKSDYTPHAILKLSQLLRYILTECNAPTIELTKEIQVLQDYMALEKNRFGARLDITTNIRGDLSGNNIAPLVLLPFVENSFKHGTTEIIEQPWISLDLQVDLHKLNFKLINGKGVNHKNGISSSHLGLSNVKRRLQLLYPDAHELAFTEDEDTFIVSLLIQLDKIKYAQV